jgi:hypothetical protein
MAVRPTKRRKPITTASLWFWSWIDRNEVEPRFYADVRKSPIKWAIIFFVAYFIFGALGWLAFAR